MKISKQRLVQIIKEELEIGDMSLPIEECSPCDDHDPAEHARLSMLEMLSGLEHNEAVDIMMNVAEELGLNSPEEQLYALEEKEESEVPADITRESIEELIAAELMQMVKK